MSKTIETLTAEFTPQMGSMTPVDHQLTRLRFRPDGKQLFASCMDGTLRRWEVPTSFDDKEFDPKNRKKMPLKELSPWSGHNGWVTAVEFHPTKSLVYSIDSWGTLLCRDHAGKQVWRLDEAHDGWIRDLAISPDGKLAATCGRDRLINLWSAEDGSLVKRFAEHEDEVYCVMFSPDSTRLVSGDWQGVVKQWSVPGDGVASEREFDTKDFYKYDRIQDVGGTRVLKFIDQGRRLVAAGALPSGGGFVKATPALRVFDFESGERLHDLTFGTSNDGYVFEVYEHPAGFLAMVTSGQPNTGKLIQHVLGEAEPFVVNTKLSNNHSITVHPDGALFAVISTNRGSNGNGRRLNKEGEYEGNSSPIHLFRWHQPRDATDTST